MFGVFRTEKADVDCENTTGDSCESSGHQTKDLGSSHFVEIGTNQQWCLRLPHENIGGRSQTFCSRKLHGTIHQPSQTKHNALKNAEIIEDGGKRGEKENGWQNGESEAIDVEGKVRLQERRFAGSMRDHGDLAYVRGSNS